MKHYKI